MVRRFVKLELDPELLTASSISPTDLPLDILKTATAIRRALPNSPKGYIPSRVACPPVQPTVRSASSLSQDEIAWLELRRNNTITPMREFLTRVNIPDFDAGSYIDRVSGNASELPNIGIAISGGGWRALLNGAGAIQAFDSRTDNSRNAGHLGGILQASTYLAGLSGGGWLVGSIFTNNFTTVTSLRDNPSGSLWEFGQSILEGPRTGGLQVFSTAQYYSHIYDEITGKQSAGFDLSLTDIWSRALSFQLVNATDGGPAYTFSSIAATECFRDGATPFPILVADGRAPGEKIVSLNASVYEFNPFEMGTWDPTAYAFVPIQYLGTEFSAGKVSANGSCVVGFDNAGYIMGTSSSLFNEFLLHINGTQLPDYLKSVIAEILAEIGQDNDDIATYSPNPFYGYNPSTNPSANNTRLTLVDGAEDNQNIPFHPLMQPMRGVDVIFAVDSSANTESHWPNGSSLVATYERTAGAIANGTNFASIPDTKTMINLGLNAHPTFFGCNISNLTTSGTDVPPLIVYLPNSPYVTFSNFSTFALTTNDSYRDAVILNGYNVATMGNGSVDETWPMCVGCAVLSRSLQRTNTAVPAACQDCFERFCWNGTLDTSTPASYQPTLRLKQVDLHSDAVSILRAAGSRCGWSIIFAALTAFATSL